MRQITIILMLLSAGLSASAQTFDTFEWAAAEISGKVYAKAAILVPVEFQGVSKRFYAQLDTGSDATILYGRCLRKHDVPVDSASDSTSSFRWYGHALKASPLQKAMVIDWDMEADTGAASETPEGLIVGTIGLDLIVGKILVLDFPATKYAVLDDTTHLSSVLPADIDFVDGAVSYNKFYLSVLLGEDTVQAVRYDCGSSTATLMLPRDWWEWATGYKGTEPEVIRDSVPAWGQYVHCLTAPAKHEMKIGKFRVMNPPVTFVDWPDPSLATGKFLGSAAFYDSCIVVVDCIHERFGVALTK
jgi:hypothetical protein